MKAPVSEHKSQSVSESVDPRIEKTRARIAAAFLALISRRSYGRVHVSDIARKAGIGRATFYAQFDSKDALLRAEFGRIVKLLLVGLPDDPALVDCTGLFAHVQQAVRIYRSLTSEPTRVVTERLLQDVIEEHIRVMLAARPVGASSLPRAAPGFVPRFVAGTMLSLIAWSLEGQDSPSPRELQTTFRALVGNALRAPIAIDASSL